MASLPSEVQDLLQAVRRRCRLLSCWRALSWVAMGLGLLLLVLWVTEGAFVASPLGRSAARLWLVLALTLPVGILVLPVWLRTRDLLRVARAVDAMAMGSDGALETAVDLSRALEDSANPWSEETRAMARVAVDRSREVASALSAVELVRGLDRRRTRGPLEGLGALPVLLALVLSWWLPAPVWQSVEGLLAAQRSAPSAQGGGESGAASLELRNLALLLRPPAYSGRQALRLEGTSGDFRALPGTQVELEAELGADGHELTVLWEGQELLLQSVSSRQIAVSFVCPGGGSYRLALSQGGGRERLLTRAFRVEALPDAPPRIEVRVEQDLELSPSEELRLDVMVADDYGLSRMNRVLLRDGVELVRRPWAEVAERREWDGTLTWNPEQDLGELGGELELVIEIYDNDTVSGPKLTRSRPVRVYVPTENDQHRRVLALKQQLLEAGLDLLAALLLDADRGGSPPVAVVLAEFDRQRELAIAFFEVAGALAQASANDVLERRSVYLAVGQLVENAARRFRTYEEFVEAELRHYKDVVLPEPVYLGLGQRRGAALVELEQALVDLSAYVDLHRGRGAQTRAMAAEQSLSAVSGLLRRGAQGEPVAEELQAALEELREQMAELAAALSERNSGPEDGFRNRLPGELGADFLAQLSKLVDEGRYDEALGRLRLAMEALSELQQALTDEQQMAGGQSADELTQQLQQAIDETRRLEQEQQALLAETRKLQGRFGDGEPFKPTEQAALAEDLEDWIEAIAALPPEGLPPRVTGGMRQRARLAYGLAVELRESWRRKADFAQAIEQGEAAVAYLDGMKDDLRQLPESLSGERDEARSRVVESMGLGRSIVQRLKDGSAAADRQRSQAGGAGQGARQRQDRLRFDVSGLRARLEDRSGLGGAAFNPTAARDGLRSAEQLMAGASSGLAQGRMARAMRSEEDALRELEGARRSLEQAQQSLQMQGGMGAGAVVRRGAGGSGRADAWRRMEGFSGDSSGGEVELPDPEDFVSPEAFRSLVQEGSVGDAPGRYRPLNRSYYEELVR